MRHYEKLELKEIVESILDKVNNFKNKFNARLKRKELNATASTRVSGAFKMAKKSSRSNKSLTDELKHYNSKLNLQLYGTENTIKISTPFRDVPKTTKRSKIKKNNKKD